MHFQDFSSGFKVQSIPEGIKDARLWEISFSVPAAEGFEPGIHNVRLGLPKDFSHWFALVRMSTPWIAPRQGRDKFAITDDAILVSFLRKDGTHMVLLALTVSNCSTVISTDGEGAVLLSARNDKPQPGTSFVIAAVGRTLEYAVAACMDHASHLILYHGNADRPSADSEPFTTEGEYSKDRDDWYNGLTYCTWNALGQDLNEVKMKDAMCLLHRNGIGITNLIIDDNWQSLDNPGCNQFERRWMDFEANKDGFPNRLKGLTAGIRSWHPDIRNVGVWHGVFGYWGGVSPEGSLAKRYATKQVNKERDLTDTDSITVFAAEDVQRVYDDFYKWVFKTPPYS